MTEQRRGDWMQTFTGRPFWPLDPRPDEIFIEDIAHALSMQCRYAGHCIRFYSVAEHCVHLARHVSPLNALWALPPASAAKARSGGTRLPSPVPRLPCSRRDRALPGAARRPGRPRTHRAEVNEADGRIIGDERINLSKCATAWVTQHEPLDIILSFWSPALAERNFLNAFREMSP